MAWFPRRTRKDRLYARTRSQVDEFRFDDQVSSVFPDMIRRSVPGYSTVLEVTGVIASHALSESDLCYDLGCSRGASTRAILSAIGDLSCQIIAVDDSEAMIEYAEREVSDARVVFVHSDIRDLSLRQSAVVVMNYVLQFLPRSDRLPVLRSIANALSPSGVLLLSEKVHDRPEFNDLHLHFKKINGYSDLEIAQKRSALENVMQIDSVDDHMRRLKSAGFSEVCVWFRCLNWVSFLARP